MNDSSINRRPTPSSSSTLLLQDAHPNTDIMMKIIDLKHVLTTDIEACDVKWSLFVAAAQSYRYDSQCKPFPPKYTTVGDCNIEQLMKVIQNTPPLHVIIYNILEENFNDLNSEVIELLHWCLISLKDPVLRSIEPAYYDRVLRKVPYTVKCERPYRIFELEPATTSIAEQKFKDYKNGYQSQFAFHGTKVDSVHSIMHYGLQQHLCKSALFGDGIYLSSEMQVSMTFAPTGCTWGGSECAREMACMFICEFIEHPTHLKCHVSKDSIRKTKSRVPEKYFVITNNDIIRIRYLLVFGQKPKPEIQQFSHPIMNWAARNSSTLTVLFYVLLLISLGFANSRTAYLMRKSIIGKFNELVDWLSHLIYP